MEAAEITRQFAYCSMFARLVPSQKAYLIRLLQRQGHRVAMIGDGTNDGLALKAADVGISFIDSSSPIARRLATILVSDLKDVLRLIEGAHKTARQARLLVWIRLVVVVGLFLGAYAWTLASQ
jgi:P-type E1-E2 ATPase